MPQLTHADGLNYLRLAKETQLPISCRLEDANFYR